MSDLDQLFKAHIEVSRWKAEQENATARLELARIRENCAYLISQHEPVNSLGVNRERLRFILSYVLHGDLKRLNQEFAKEKHD